MREILCNSKNGERVFFDIEKTNIRLHIIENNNLLTLMKEAIEKSDVTGDKVALQVDLGRVVGTTSCVPTDENDEIVYAKRIDREKYSRFVKHRELLPTTSVVVILFKESDGYMVWSGWCGELLPQEPDGEGGTRTARDFEQTHALVFDPRIIQSDTITNKEPLESV